MNAPVESWSELTLSFFRSYVPVLIISLALFAGILAGRSQTEQPFCWPNGSHSRALTSVLAGDKVEPVKFRENDFWRSLAEDFNQALKQRDQLQTAIGQGDRTPQ